MSTEKLADAFAGSRRIIAGVAANQMVLPTPCQSWDVAALINHMVSAPRFAASAVATRTNVEDDREFTKGDYLAAYDESREEALSAFGAPGALEKMVVMPFGEIPGAVLMEIITGDQFMHGWDLARATGQPTTLDPQQAQARLDFARVAIQPEFRGADGDRPFGPEREAPEGAGPADQLAAFLGRSV